MNPPAQSSIPKSSSPSTGNLSGDELLAHLLAGLSEQARQGEIPDVNAVISQHPEVGNELRELWAAAQFADAFIQPTPSGTRSARQTQVSSQEASSPPPPGGPLPRTFGEYELLEELGRGGMGIVYKARQENLGRMVALKMILNGELATSEDLARFEAEARAAAQLDHPHIVPVYGSGAQDGQAYFSMRYVEGQTLSELLTRGPLPPFEAARYMALISRAVHYAHERGILHRDLKPSNILIDSDHQPHITDFGLAKRVRSASGSTSHVAGLTQTGALVGTPTYMAPEQVSHSRGIPSSVSDVYSLGVILYECLTGRPPFQAANPVDTLLLVLDQDPVRPRLLNRNVHPDLELICLKCLQKEPDLRYNSAAELADDLEAFLQGNTLSVRSGRITLWFTLFNRIFRETHHAVVLENWGMLWMYHSLKIFLLCALTNGMKWAGVRNPLWYLLLWTGSLVVWGAIFWNMRKRGGPVLFVERQVAHIWGGAIAATVGVFVVEMLLPRLPGQERDVLLLAPLLAVIAGMVFAVKAGMLSGTFYAYSALLFLTAIPMALYPDWAVLLFGLVTALCFFIPGLKYHRQRLRTLARKAEQHREPG